MPSDKPRIDVRVEDEQERQTLNKAAARAGKSVSQWARAILLAAARRQLKSKR